MVCVAHHCEKWWLHAISVLYLCKRRLAFEVHVKGATFSRMQKRKVTMYKLKQIRKSYWCELCPVLESYMQKMKAVFFISHAGNKGTIVLLHSLKVGYARFGSLAFAVLPRNVCKYNQWTHTMETREHLMQTCFMCTADDVGLPACKIPLTSTTQVK